MPTAAIQNRFSYQARDARGQLVSGIVTALTIADATKVLRAEGKYPLSLSPTRGGAAPEAARAQSTGSSTSGIKRDEVINFTIQLSVMVDTGVPLSEALTALSEQALTPNFAVVLKTIVNDVQGGKDFSAALERYPRLFSTCYISLVKASEMSGSMGPILRRLADNLVNQRETAKKVRGALIYPSFMLGMSIIVTVFLLTVVLPRFTAIFAARKAALPMPTQVLMAVSDGLIHYWYAWLLGVSFSAALSIWYIRTPKGRIAMDYIKLHLPIFGPMFHKLHLSRSLQTIGTMVSSGVQMLDCLQIARDVAGNHYYSRLWDEVREKIQAGQQFSEPLLRSPLVPRSVSYMLNSGEKTGELPQVMTRVAGFMEEDLRTAIKTTTQFIEPIMIGIMGILVGGVAIAMLLPILTISKVMAQG